MADALLYRHWTAWKDGTRTHIFLRRRGIGRRPRPDARQLRLARLPARRTRCSTRSRLTARSCASSPTTIQQPAQSRPTTISGCCRSPTPDAKPRNITAGNPAYDGSPKYSPDGRYIAYRTQKQPGYESDLFRLARLRSSDRDVARCSPNRSATGSTISTGRPIRRSIYFSGRGAGPDAALSPRPRDESDHPGARRQDDRRVAARAAAQRASSTSAAASPSRRSSSCADLRGGSAPPPAAHACQRRDRRRSRHPSRRADVGRRRAAARRFTSSS